MRMAAFLTVLAAMLVPFAASAQGACDHRRHTSAAISCAEGHVWDGEASRCVPVDS